MRLRGLQNRQNLLDNNVTGLQKQNQVYVGRSMISGPLGAGLMTVQSISVPAGDYLIYAIVPTTNGDTDDQTGECVLSPPGKTAQGLPIHPLGSDSDAFYRIRGAGFSLNGSVPWQAQLPLLYVASFASYTNITLSCQGFNWFVNPTLIAVSIGNIH